MTNASDIAYRIIRKSIIDGDLVQGEKISEEAMVRLCDVSRTPVRDALRQLSFEGYVLQRKNQGAWVKSWSDEEVKEVYEARARMEGLIVRLVATKISDAGLAKLATNTDDMARVIAHEQDPLALAERFLGLNREFHDQLYEIANNPRLSDLMPALSPPPVVHKTAKNFNRDRVQQSNEDHRALVRAFSKSDANWAESVVKSHIYAAYVSYRDGMPTTVMTTPPLE